MRLREFGFLKPVSAMNTPLLRIRESLAHLLFPRLCEGCQQPLLYQEEVLCLGCALALPRSGFHHLPLNEAALRLAGRIPFEWATAFGIFTVEGLLQHLLHRLKYAGRTEVGRYLGRQAGWDLQRAAWTQDLDGIVPVPLHPAKLRQRGYNQASVLAGGLSEILNVPVYDQLLRRTRHTSSQTLKSRQQRVENVGEAFALQQAPAARSHFLLVDDVLTTGATLEAAARPLLLAPEVRVSILAFALAQS
jgi:ComF family protein